MIRIGTRKSVCSYLWSYELWHPKIIYRNWKPACLLAYITSSLRHCMTRYTLSDKHWLASEQMVEWWFWWDSTQAWYRRLTDFIQCFDAVSLVIWPVKIVPEMTYYVSSGTLNLADSLCGRVDISQTGVSRQHLLCESILDGRDSATGGVHGRVDESEGWRFWLVTVASPNRPCIFC